MSMNPQPCNLWCWAEVVYVLSAMHDSKCTCLASQLPVYVPNAKECADPALYAANVRDLMLRVGGFEPSTATMVDCRAYIAMLKVCQKLLGYSLVALFGLVILNRRTRQIKHSASASFNCQKMQCTKSTCDGGPTQGIQACTQPLHVRIQQSQSCHHSKQISVMSLRIITVNECSSVCSTKGTLCYRLWVADLALRGYHLSPSPVHKACLKYFVSLYLCRINPRQITAWLALH